MNKGETSPAQTAIQVAFGFINARALYVAAKLGVADYLKGGPKTAVELAAALSVKADALHRIMRVLAASGVFELDTNDRFSLNEISGYITDGPGAIGAGLRDFLSRVRLSVVCPYRLYCAHRRIGSDQSLWQTRLRNGPNGPCLRGCLICWPC